MAHNRPPAGGVRRPDQKKPRNGAGTVAGVVDQLTRTQRPDLVARAQQDQVGIHALIAELQAAKGGEQPAHVIAMLNRAISLAEEAVEQVQQAERNVADAIALGAAAAGRMIYGKDYIPQVNKLPSPFPETVDPPVVKSPVKPAEIPKVPAAATTPANVTPPTPPRQGYTPPRPPIPVY